MILVSITVYCIENLLMRDVQHCGTFFRISSESITVNLSDY